MKKLVAHCSQPSCSTSLRFLVLSLREYFPFLIIGDPQPESQASGLARV